MRRVQANPIILKGRADNRDVEPDRGAQRDGRDHLQVAAVMAEETRDIAVRTATKLESVEQKLDTALVAIEALKADLNERKGMERLAGWIRTGVSGGLGSGLTLMVFKFFGVPLPK